MFGDGALAFQEFAMSESLPLATVHDAVLDYLRGRDDAVLQGAQAVNAYVDEPRMTQDVEILALRAEEFAESLRQFLNDRFHIAVRVRNIRDGLGFRLYQIRKPKNRHLVDVRSVEHLPPNQPIADILVLTPVELVASKVLSYHNRRGRPKGFTDLRDLAVLLLAFPELKTASGRVRDRLEEWAQDDTLVSTWNEIVVQKIQLDDEDEEFFAGKQRRLFRLRAPRRDTPAAHSG
ncbi:MAG: nucleotidyl transferase AbiEii/AbiGii toxin family protein [Planctomycetes bacterium]|nr:nucleotidyl transferase AbiEii/AbiGii toxin family protein [Planctomycetota bacterium]